MTDFGIIVVPLMICSILGWGFFQKTDVYAAFTEGVIKGTKSVASVFPSLFALFIAISVFRASGLVDFITNLLSPLCDFLHFPPELLPFAILRPVSGSGSMAMASDIFAAYGTDSLIGRAASVMMGSTETTFYTIAVYFGASGTQNIRHTLKCALAADIFSMAASIAVCRWYF